MITSQYCSKKTSQLYPSKSCVYIYIYIYIYITSISQLPPNYIPMLSSDSDYPIEHLIKSSSKTSIMRSTGNSDNDITIHSLILILINILIILFPQNIINNIYIYIWVCLKMVSTPKPNGFADHYPVFKWLAIIGNINPTFSGPNPYLFPLKAGFWPAVATFGWICDQVIRANPSRRIGMSPAANQRALNRKINQKSRFKSCKWDEIIPATGWLYKLYIYI